MIFDSKHHKKIKNIQNLTVSLTVPSFYPNDFNCATLIGYFTTFLIS